MTFWDVLLKGHLGSMPRGFHVAGVGSFSRLNLLCAFVICCRLRSEANALVACSLDLCNAAILCCSGEVGICSISQIFIMIFSAVST